MVNYVALRSGGIRWRVDASLRAAFASGPFADFAALLAAGRPIKDLKVKRAVEVSALGRTWLVKIYKAGSWLQSLRRKVAGSRAKAELAALERMLELGLPTLPFAAAGDGPRESYVLIEVAADRERLDELYARRRGTSRGRDLAAEYGRWARRFHDAGVDQYDFNPSNVLAKSEGGPDLRFIDFERVRYRALGEEARLRALAKIDRMVEASRTDRWRFLSAYFGGGDLKARARRLAERTAAQRRRDAARRREACVEENRNYGSFSRGGVSGHYRKRSDAGGVEAGDLDSLAGSGGPWRRVPAAKAVAAWREANGSPGGERPVAVVVRSRSGAGELVYRA